MKTLDITFPDKKYNIYISKDFNNDYAGYIKEVYQGKKIYIICDDNIKRLHLKDFIASLEADFKVDTIVIKNGEDAKNIETYQFICERLIEKNLRRNELIIALGGGVIGDITGFVASTIYRGVNFINVPTTLLSMVDSSIGGKTGIDFFGMKNILGTFYQPKLVLINLAYLKTLPEEEMKSGMGELIKHAFIGDRSLYDDLMYEEEINEDIIFKSLKVKRKLVMEDEFDQGVRMYLNFGHTFGHIIELKYNLKHGIAVVNGMAMALKFGIDLNITDADLLDYLLIILDKFKIEIKDYDYKEYLSAAFKDKKNLAGKLNYILLRDFERPTKYEVIENNI